jgi:hypothetical protein
MREQMDDQSSKIQAKFLAFNKDDDVTVANYNLGTDELPHLDLIYDFVRWFPSDICDHLPILKYYASKCKTVCELGTNDFTSTIALLSGFPDHLLTVDVAHPDMFALSFEPFNPSLEKTDEPLVIKITLDLMLQLAAINRVDLHFKQISSLEFSFNSVDLLFIDTLHTYTQLSRELRLHDSKVKKYIILHDTALFAEKGQDAKDEDGNYLCPEWETKGLGHALEEFLENPYTGWVIENHIEQCNGLTILKRAWID